MLVLAGWKALRETGQPRFSSACLPARIPMPARADLAALYILLYVRVCGCGCFLFCYELMHRITALLASNAWQSVQCRDNRNGSVDMFQSE